MCLLAGVAGGAFGAYRTAYGLVPAVVDWDHLQETPVPGLGAARLLSSHATLRVVTPDWRPLLVRVEMVNSASPSAPRPEIRVEADGWSIGSLWPPPGRSTQTLHIFNPPAQREKLQLRLLHEGGAPIAFTAFAIVPQVTRAGLVKHAFGGVLVGFCCAALWLLIRVPPPAPRQASDAVSTRAGIGRLSVVAAVVMLYFSVWAGLKPVLQAPDEPQHLMKANAVLRQPWLTAGAQFEHAPRFINPLALWTPPALDRVFFHADVRLSGADVDALKRVAWWGPAEPSYVPPYHVALASYPALYYLVTFSLSEPLIAASGATPYQAIFVYRVVTVVIAAVLWAAVYAELRRTADLRASLGLLLVFLLANPMLAFVSSAVNADAFAIPLCIGGAIASWRLLSTGEGRLRACVWLVAAALVKPAGIQMIVAVAVAAPAAWYWRRELHVVATVVTMARALAVAFAAFYGWSYIHLYASPPLRPSPIAYLAASIRSIDDVWVMYWGQLGWLDYALPTVFYLLLLIPVAWCAWEGWRSPALSRQAQIYFAICFAGFAATMYAVEYLYLHESGYFIQGRYFLPGSIGLAPLVLHRGAAARATLVGAVVALNLLLGVATVHRYYADDWPLVWRALPFAAPTDAAAVLATDPPPPKEE